MVDLYFKRLTKDAIIPNQPKTSDDAGWDIYANEEVIVYPNKTTTVSTGIAMQAKFVNYKDSLMYKLYIKVDSPSGNASKLGISVIGGIIDQGYTGEVKVILVNHTANPIKILKGKKIGQLIPKVIPKINKVTVLNENEIFEATTRGSDGFGSTGLGN